MTAPLSTAAERLRHRLRGASPSWYAARTASGSATREQALRELVERLADLGRQAGSGAPAGAVPGQVAVHALADQLAVLVEDLLALNAPQAETAAAAAVSACYDQLWV